MEGALDIKKLFIEVRTHGFTVLKHVNWDDLNWVAITPAGSVVLFRDRTDYMVYAVYSSYKGRYHVHIPLSDVTVLDERANKVLKEVLECLHLAECYIDRTTAIPMIYSVNRFRLRDFIPFGMGNHVSNIRR
ncbi:hypothetical protein [Sulfurisphaera ohwakuensis]|uniref:hypothetical protein n=1 Tax=Sulfurisphaera ohwakuensis TaxID=69656 RepID=UPI0036F2861D